MSKEDFRNAAFNKLSKEFNQHEADAQERFITNEDMSEVAENRHNLKDPLHPINAALFEIEVAKKAAEQNKQIN